MTSLALRPRVAALLAVTALTSVAMLLAQPAWAHSGLVSSTPMDGSVVTEAPSAIVLTFNEELLDDADAISLNTADGEPVVSARVQPTGDTVELPWPADLAAGEYEAAFRVVSADGHPINGSIRFTYAPAETLASDQPDAVTTAEAAPSMAPTPAESTDETTAESGAVSGTTEPESTGGTPWLGLGIGVVIGLVLVVLFAAMRRKRS